MPKPGAGDGSVQLKPVQRCTYHHNDAFAVQELISQGSFGKIYRVVSKGTGQILALKQVPLQILSRVDRQEAIDEARMLSKLDHPNIVRHLDSFVDDNMLNIVMEYASGGTVHHMRKSGRLSESHIWKYCIQLLQAVSYIHSQRIVHRDIKTLNVFLDELDNVKLGDFGIARALSEGTNLLHTLVGTPFYLAPELCEDKPYNTAADIWAVGICLYEMCMGAYPFTAKNEGALIRKILKGQYPQPSGYSADLLNIIKLCLAYDAKKRPSASVLLSRPEISAKAASMHAAQARQQQIKSHTDEAHCSLSQHDGGHTRLADHQEALVLDCKPCMESCGEDKQRHPFALDPTKDGKAYSPHVSQPGAAVLMEHTERVRVTAMGYQAAGYAHKEFPSKHVLTAGLKQDYTDRSSPFSKDQESGSLHDKRCDSQALWTHKYQRPQYARKRCPDLMVSGPSTRAAPVTGQTFKTRGFHAYEASVGSTTTYQQHTSGDT